MFPSSLRYLPLLGLLLACNQHQPEATATTPKAPEAPGPDLRSLADSNVVQLLTDYGRQYPGREVLLQTRHGNMRILFDAVNGTDQAARLSATTKLWWSETHRATMDLAMDVLGAEGQVLTGDAEAAEDWIPGVGLRRGRPDYPASPAQRAFLFSRSDTIGGGTSEIQRNVIARRVLKLPR